MRHSNLYSNSEKTGKSLANFSPVRLSLIENFSVAAGTAFPLENPRKRTIDLLDFLAGDPTRDFVFQVNGDSMQNAGIFDGDYVIVDKGASAKHGDYVIASFDGNFVAKRLSTVSGKPVLKSENSKFPDIVIGDLQDLVIEGVIKHSIHSLSS